MDFFEAQDRARHRTTRLVVLFILAVLGTIAALYFAFVGLASILGLQSDARDEDLHDYSGPPSAHFSKINWWQPNALHAICWIVLPMVGGAALFKWLSLRNGGPAIAEQVGGRRVDPATQTPAERRLLNVVEEMSIASGVPAPAVYVLPDEPGINAFAAGYNPADAAIAVTRGALERLDRDELQGVIAHEFSHILNGDMRLNTRLVALLYGILALVILGRILLRGGFSIARHSSGRTRKNNASISLPLILAGLVVMTAGGIGYLFGRLLQTAVSRQREHLADAAAVQFTRNPLGLAGALKKVGSAALGGRFVHPAAGEVSHFCFAQNYRNFTPLASVFSTHPPLKERIRRLDPNFDGIFPELKPLLAEDPPTTTATPRHPPPPLLPAPARTTLTPAGLIATAGILKADTLEAAQKTLSALPPEVTAAARDPARAPLLAYAICLDPRLPSVKRSQALDALATMLGREAAEAIDRLDKLIATVPADCHLSLLQIAAPALRSLDSAARDQLLEALDTLMHADGKICPREFAFQKILIRELRLAARPRTALLDLAPAQASPHLSVTLSACARFDAPDDETAATIFARAAAGFGGLHPPLTYVPATRATLGHLDVALDKLALTPAPFRKRVLTAVGLALTGDDSLSPAEAYLLRAIGAALDCPLPPPTNTTA